jgi:hypothetical protein
MFREGFFVSPAVIPRLSVPPSTSHEHTARVNEMRRRTGEAGCHEHAREATDPSDERCAGYAPVGEPDRLVSGIETDVDSDPDEHERDDRNDLERRKPILYAVVSAAGGVGVVDAPSSP